MIKEWENHLAKESETITIPLNFKNADGKEWVSYYTYKMRPVLKDFKCSWESSPSDDDLLFEKWCRDNQYKSKTATLYEAINTFHDVLYDLCLEKIMIGEKNYISLLNKLKNKGGALDVAGAKNYPIEELMKRYGYEPRMGFTKCPFHDDSTPSFKIYPSSNTWYCWGCHEHGDTIGFVMKKDGVSFKDAIKSLTF
jgi:hypothetical protein